MIRPWILSSAKYVNLFQLIEDTELIHDHEYEEDNLHLYFVMVRHAVLCPSNGFQFGKTSKHVQCTMVRCLVRAFLVDLNGLLLHQKNFCCCALQGSVGWPEAHIHSLKGGTPHQQSLVRLDLMAV